MSASIRKRRSVASKPISNRPQTITGHLQQQKQLNEEEQLERRQRESEAKRRRIRRRLDELERVNYRDVPSNTSGVGLGGNNGASASFAGMLAAVREEDTDPLIHAGSSGSAKVDHAAATNREKTGAQKKRNQAELKRLLASRRNFNTMLEEAIDQGKISTNINNSKEPNWLTAASRRDPNTPVRRFCSICGFHGDITCIRCGERYCSLRCGSTHDETRCERPIR